MLFQDFMDRICFVERQFVESRRTAEDRAKLEKDLHDILHLVNMANMDKESGCKGVLFQKAIQIYQNLVIVMEEELKKSAAS